VLGELGQEDGLERVRQVCLAIGSSRSRLPGGTLNGNSAETTLSSVVRM
jgi:hypothetical protein